MGLTIRRAVRADLPALIRMLADDKLGAQREVFGEELPQSYYEAFECINADANQQLLVACLGDEVVGTLQLTFIRGLSHQGSWRAQIESMRIDSAHRSQGYGQQLVERALDMARAKRCHLAQLTTNKERPDAHRFYARLGFVASHEGMKLAL